MQDWKYPFVSMALGAAVLGAVAVTVLLVRSQRTFADERQLGLNGRIKLLDWEVERAVGSQENVVNRARQCRSGWPTGYKHSP